MTITIFHVGQADSQLIVFPSGYSILIDLGENRDDFEPTNARYVSQRLEQILPNKTIDVLVLTHVHLDHFGYPANHTGLWYLIEEAGFEFKKYIGRNIGTFNGSDLNGCNRNSIDWKYVGEYEQYNVDWICYAHNLQNQNQISKVRETAEVCSIKQIQPPDKNATIQIVMADAFTVKKQDGSLVASNWKDTTNPPSENDYSISLKVQYGDFIYFTGGDLDGSKDFSFGTEISNAEEKIEDIVGSVDVYRVNHHGDYHSSSASFLNKMKPTISVVSCGENNRYGLPHQPTMNRLSLNTNTIYLTENCNPAVTSNHDNVEIMGDDIIIGVELGKSHFEITNPQRNYSKTIKIKEKKELTKDCNTLFENRCNSILVLAAFFLILFA